MSLLRIVMTSNCKLVEWSPPHTMKSLGDLIAEHRGYEFPGAEWLEKQNETDPKRVVIFREVSR